MAETKHTPGPWKIGSQYPYIVAITAPRYMTHGTTTVSWGNETGGQDWPAIDKAEREANARLIAAAPDLLVVCHNLAETMGIDYAIKKLSTLSDDTMALGAATILKGIQRQAKETLTKLRKENYNG